jgi:hypothetical protein
LDISDSDDVFSESPRKRQKADRKAIGGQNIINLCSDDDSEVPPVTSNGEEVIVLSGDEADCIPNRLPLVVCNTDPEVSRSAAGMDEEVKSRNITPKSGSDPGDVSLTQDVLNSLYKESLKQAPPAFSGTGHPPAFLLRSSVAVNDVPSRDVAHTEEPATPGLLTTRFFARAISAITALRPMGTHKLGVGQTLSTSGVSETAGAERTLVDVSASPGSGKSPSLEDARVEDTQAPIEVEVEEVSDVSQSNDLGKCKFPMCLSSTYVLISNISGVSLPDPCISQPLSGISLPATMALAGTSEEITNTVVESTQDRKSPMVIQLEDTRHASPSVGVEPPESTLQEAAGRASPERKDNSFEQLFDESDTCGDVEMRLDEPLESFSISSDIDVPMSAPDPGEAEISSIVVEEPARKDSCDTPSVDNSNIDVPMSAPDPGEAEISSIVVEEPARKDSCDTPSVDNSSTDCDGASQSQKIHIHLIDPSIFENPKVHILLNCLKDVIVDQDKLTSFDLGYPDFAEEMTREW